MFVWYVYLHSSCTYHTNQPNVGVYKYTIHGSYGSIDILYATEFLPTVCHAVSFTVWLVLHAATILATILIALCFPCKRDHIQWTFHIFNFFRPSLLLTHKYVGFQGVYGKIATFQRSYIPRASPSVPNYNISPTEIFVKEGGSPFLSYFFEVRSLWGRYNWTK